jgi:CID domain
MAKDRYDKNWGLKESLAKASRWAHVRGFTHNPRLVSEIKANVHRLTPQRRMVLLYVVNALLSRQKKRKAA